MFMFKVWFGLGVFFLVDLEMVLLRFGISLFICVWGVGLFGVLGLNLELLCVDC